MQWTVKTPACACRCPAPDLVIEYKSVAASSGYLVAGDGEDRTYTWKTADDLIAGYDFDAVEWNDTVTVDLEGDGHPGGGQTTYAQRIFGAAYAPDADPPTFQPAGSRGAVRTKMRVRAISNGEKYTLTIRFAQKQRPTPATAPGAYSFIGEPIATEFDEPAPDEGDEDPEPVTIWEGELPTPEDPILGPANPDFPGVEQGACTIRAQGPELGGPRRTYDTAGRNQYSRALKIGFMPYIGDAPETPKVYLKESVSGGSPGCRASGEPVRSYSGAREWVEEETADPAFPVGPSPYTLSNTLSDDAKGHAALSPAAPGFVFPGGTVDFPTERTHSREFKCGETAREDKITLTLSDEITTAKLKLNVSAFVNAILGMDDVLTSPELHVGEFLATDEMSYELGKGRFYLVPPPGAGSSVSLGAWSNAETLETTFRARKRKWNRATGALEETEYMQTLTLTNLAVIAARPDPDHPELGVPPVNWASAAAEIYVVDPLADLQIWTEEPEDGTEVVIDEFDLTAPEAKAALVLVPSRE